MTISESSKKLIESNKTEIESWKPTVKWYKISIESYKIIIDLAKERLEEVLAESQSITEKSIKMLTGLLALMVFLFQFGIKQNQVNLIELSLIVLLFTSAIYLLMRLIMPKEVRYKGLAPYSSLPPELDHPEDIDFQEQNISYFIMLNLQYNISFMIEKNKSRIVLYKRALSLLIGLVLMVGYVVLKGYFASLVD